MILSGRALLCAGMAFLLTSSATYVGASEGTACFVSKTQAVNELKMQGQRVVEQKAFPVYRVALAVLQTDFDDDHSYPGNALRGHSGVGSADSAEFAHDSDEKHLVATQAR